MIVLSVAGIVWLHLSVAGPIPSGGDGGNWLALAHELLGVDVLTPGVSYPPAFTIALALFILVMDPVPALVVVALLARVVAVIAVYVVMRDSGRVAAVLTAALTATAAFQLEAFAWGAYPQILASGFALVAVYYSMRFAGRARRVDAVVAALAALGVLATHNLVAGLLVIALPIALMHSAWISEDVRRNWKPALTLSVSIMALGLTYLIAGIVGGEGRAVLNPNELDYAEGIRLAIGESLVPWIIIGVIGLSSLIHRHWDLRWRYPVSVGVGLLLAGTGVFILTVERRSLLIAQIGLLILAAMEMQRWWLALRERRLTSKVLLVLTAALVGSISVPGIVEYERSTDFYRIVDRLEIDSIRRLGEISDPGDTVVASRGRNTIPIGWWVEGITKMPTMSGHDPRYLTFAAEVEEAEAANAFFEGTDSDDAARLLADLGAEFIIVDKRGPDAGWLDQADSLELVAITETSSLVILRVDQ